MRADLLLALARRASDSGDPGMAWQFAEAAHAITPRPADAVDRLQASIDAAMSLYHRLPRIEADPDEPRHIYLCSAPRTGSSLVQSVMAAARGAVSLGERGSLLPYILDGGLLPARADSELKKTMLDLRAADKRGIARAAKGADHVIDKTPMNIAAVGALARIRPNARFLAILRDPADTAISIFLRRFPPAYGYTSRIGDIVAFLELQAQTIRRWQERGMAIACFRYEDLASDPGPQFALLCEMLGLPFDTGKLKARSRRQPVATFSAEQVRQEIGPGLSGHSFAGKAMAFADQLAPHADALNRVRDLQEGLLQAGA